MIFQSNDIDFIEVSEPVGVPIHDPHYLKQAAMYYLKRNATSDSGASSKDTVPEKQDLSKASSSIPRPVTTESANNNKKPHPQKPHISPSQQKDQTKGNLDNNATPSKRGYRAKPIYRVKEDSEEQLKETSVETSKPQTSTQTNPVVTQDNTPNRGYKKRPQKVFRPVQSQDNSGDVGTSYDIKK